MEKNHKYLQYRSALGFYENSIQLAKRISTGVWNEGFEISPTAAVNLSFSIELFLKLIYNISTENIVKREHRLDSLFLALPIPIQNRIEELYEVEKNNTQEKLYQIKISFNDDRNNPKNMNDILYSSTLTQLLKTHSDGFIKWRYLYEVKDEYYYYIFDFSLLNSFAKALIKTIDELENSNHYISNYE